MAAVVGMALLLWEIRRAPETYPWGDTATTSIYAIRAARGNLPVGAWSRFHWNHPGPLLYQILAPLYALSGYREISIKWTMLGLNLAALAGLFAVVRARAPTLAVVLAVMLIPLIDREQRLFFWAWNPVAPVLPLALTVGVAAGAAAGSVRLLPLLCAVSSFIVQSHVAFVLPVVSILLTMIAVAAWQTRRGRLVVEPRQLAGPIAVSIAVVLALWAVPVAHELRTRPGNLEAIARFFLASERDARPWSTVFALFAHQFVGPLTAKWEVTTGAASQALSWQVVIAAAVQFPLLVLVSVRAFRRQAIYEGAFAALSLAAAVAALLAVRSVVGSVSDYLITWIAVIGALSLASIAAGALPALGPSLPGGRVSRWVLAGYLVAVAIVSGMRLTNKHESDSHSIIMRRLAAELDSYSRAEGLDRPLLGFSDAAYDGATGVLLQYYKHDRPIAVSDEWVFLVGDPFKANGHESAEFYLMMEDEGTLPEGVTRHVWLTTFGSYRLIRVFRGS
jgi:hypothetical protein